MERLKDFFYNKSDILVALLILILAAVVVVFCVKSIMGYPSHMTATESAAVMDMAKTMINIC